ncbi:MAG: ABC transporter permease [Chloroflexi bacterium]|nr:ABC transporter permease [Chloroflexota bacterium]
MHNFLLMLKKELWHSWSSSKIVTILALFALLSIVAPFMQYQKSISSSSYVVLRGGELLYEFYYLYIGILLIILIPFMVMSVVAGEIKNNTAASLLVKPIGRTGYILSKFIVYFLIFGLAATIAILCSAVYANALAFEPIEFSVIWSILALILVFIAFAVALMLFLSTIIRNQNVAGAIGLSLLMGLFFIRLLPAAGLLPGKLLAWAWEKVSMTLYPNLVEQGLWENVHASWPAFFVTIASSAVFIIVSIFIIKRREL